MKSQEEVQETLRDKRGFVTSVESCESDLVVASLDLSLQGASCQNAPNLLVEALILYASALTCKKRPWTVCTKSSQTGDRISNYWSWSAVIIDITDMELAILMVS